MPQAASGGKSGRRAAVLAFDLGASNGRALAGELLEEKDGRRLAVTEIHRFPNGPVETCGHLYWDILRLLQEVKAGIRKAFREGFRPESFGIDTWGVDFGLIDRNGELIGNPYHYRDAQTEGLIDEVAALVGKRELYEQGGLQFMPFNTIYQLYAMAKARSPKLDAAETLLLTPDLLAYLLTGRKVCEFTMATTTQLLNPLTKQWNTALMERLGIPPRLFLDVVPPGTRIGPLSDAVCRELGVPPVEAVAVATHDTESAAAAVPAGEEPFVYLVCGTWSLLGTELDRPLLTPLAMELAYRDGAAGTGNPRPGGALRPGKPGSALPAGGGSAGAPHRPVVPRIAHGRRRHPERTALPFHGQRAGAPCVGRSGGSQRRRQHSRAADRPRPLQGFARSAEPCEAFVPAGRL